MPTTVMPAAHDASMASSAVTPFEAGAVARAGGHGDDGRGGEPADDAGQRALHPGDDHDGVGRGQLVGRVEHAVQAGHADVGDAQRAEAVGLEHRRALVGHREVGGAGGDQRDLLGDARAPGRHTSVEPCRAPPGLAASAAVACASSARVRSTGRPTRRPAARPRWRALVGLLARRVDGLGHALAQRAVVVDPGEAEIGEGQAAQLGHRVVGGDGAGSHVVEQLTKAGLVHVTILTPRDRIRRIP